MTNLEMYRGDDKTFNLTFTDSDGDPIDLTDAKVFLTVKRRQTDADSAAIIAKKVTSHSQATGGITAVTVTHTDSAVDVGSYYYDIQLVDSNTDVTTITTGSFTIKRDITIGIT
jgi:hypothetical protein